MPPPDQMPTDARAQRSNRAAPPRPSEPFSYRSRLHAGARLGDVAHEGPTHARRAAKATRRPRYTRSPASNGRLATIRSLAMVVRLLMRIAGRRRLAGTTPESARGVATDVDALERLLALPAVPEPAPSHPAERTPGPLTETIVDVPRASRPASVTGAPARLQRHRAWIVVVIGFVPALMVALVTVLAVQAARPGRSIELRIDSFIEWIIVGSVAAVALVIVGFRYLSRSTSIAQDDSPTAQRPT